MDVSSLNHAKIDMDKIWHVVPWYILDDHADEATSKR